ncbi:hypothetical protein K2173_028088 [Erythroxylum novogranatense]|uniref:Uncharacterized protein n=1 Tax=Erythroxylum novogranatense TaxID=1862640 RepID=A0AAV8U0W2_9ROSI|nr:hypothetical protein K2173_028088 [Erythroxylum novogranatense]
MSSDLVGNEELEVRKVSRKPKIVLPKCVRDEIAEKWNVLVAEEERGQLKVVSRFNSPPSTGNIDSLITKDLESYVTGEKN